MRSYDLMRISKPAQSLIQNLQLEKKANEEAKQGANNEEVQEENSIFANSPIANCEITGKKKGSSSGNSEHSGTPNSAKPEKDSSAKQQTFASVMKDHQQQEKSNEPSQK